MNDGDLQQALTMREIVGAYGTAVHVATTLKPPPSPVLFREDVADVKSARPPSLLKRAAIRFLVWLG